MTYALSAPLQAAVFAVISVDPGVTDLVGANIFETPPTGQLPGLYVTIGGEKAKDASDQTGGGAIHEFSVAVVSEQAGFAAAKEVAGRICDAVLGADLVLTRGTAVSVSFLRARAVRTGNGAARRIDLIFRARLCDG